MAMSGDLAWMDETAGTDGLMHNSEISVIGCGSVPPCTPHWLIQHTKIYLNSIIKSMRHCQQNPNKKSSPVPVGSDRFAED